MSHGRWEAEYRARSPRLAVAVLVLAVVWLGILPAVGNRPEVRRYIDQNRRQGINPSAKFYTELPVMPHIRRRMEETRRRNDVPGW
jgi:hypothetical protein